MRQDGDRTSTTSAGESGRKTCVHANPSDTWEGLSRGSQLKVSHRDSGLPWALGWAHAPGRTESWRFESQSMQSCITLFYSFKHFLMFFLR